MPRERQGRPPAASASSGFPGRGVPVDDPIPNPQCYVATAGRSVLIKRYGAGRGCGDAVDGRSAERTDKSGRTGQWRLAAVVLQSISRRRADWRRASFWGSPEFRQAPGRSAAGVARAGRSAPAFHLCQYCGRLVAGAGSRGHQTPPRPLGADSGGQAVCRSSLSECRDGRQHPACRAAQRAARAARHRRRRLAHR